ncbi:hypothetical protein DFH06DRAFT_285943 [Mycena polygramma]|nr:hypothetical protein DFH06DRAFT_285943 [Mycena polygramma]
MSEVVFLWLGSGSTALWANERLFHSRLTLPPHEFEWGEPTSLPLAQLSPQPGTSNASPQIGTPTGPGSQSTLDLVAGISSAEPSLASASSTPIASTESSNAPITVPRSDSRSSSTIDVFGPASLENFDSDIFTPMDLPNASTSTIDTPNPVSDPVPGLTVQDARQSISVDGSHPSVDTLISPTENLMGSSSGILAENTDTRKRTFPHHRNTY